MGNYFDCVGLINNPLNDSQSYRKLSYYTYKKMFEILEGSVGKTLIQSKKKTASISISLSKKTNTFWLRGMTTQQNNKFSFRE